MVSDSYDSVQLERIGIMVHCISITTFLKNFVEIFSGFSEEIVNMWNNNNEQRPQWWQYPHGALDLVLVS